MILLKNLILTELGETTDSYDWSYDGRKFTKAIYSFYSEDIEYEVSYDKEGDRIKVEFAPKKGEVEQSDQTMTRSSIETNQGNQFRIVATVMDTTKHLWRNKEDIYENGDELTHFVFSRIGKRDDNPREKLYKKFIKKQLPQAEIKKSGHYFEVYL